MAIIVNNSFDEEQKRRAEAARARGMDEASIQKFQLIDRIKQQQMQPQPQQQVTQPEANKPSNLKKFLVNTGAIAGQIGAGIGSAALAPVTGGVSLAGGFAAGAGIEALRRKLLGEKQSIAASALEGGLTILSGVVEGVKALKGAKVAGELAGAGKAATAGANIEKQALKDRLLSAFKNPAETGKITEIGSNVRGAQRGIQAGEKVAGGAKGAVYTEKTAAEVNQVVDQANKGIVPKSVRGQIKNVQAEKEAVGQAQQQAAQASKAVVDNETRAVMDSTVEKGRSKILKFDPENTTHTKINNRYAARLDGAKTPEQLLEQRKIFDGTAKATYLNPTTEQTVEKELARVYRDAADKAIAKLAPEVKTLDRQFSLLTKAENTMTAKSSRLNPKGFAPFGTTVNGQGIGGNAVQAVKEGAGKSLQVVGKVAQSPIVKAGLTQGIARSLTKPYLDMPTDPNIMQTQPDGSFKPANGATNDTFNINDLSAQFSQAGITDPQQMFDALNAAEQPQQTNQNTTSRSEQYMQAADNALQAGDVKSATTFMSFAKTSADMEAAQLKASQSATGKNMGNVGKLSAQSYTLAQQGTDALQKLAQLVQADPGVINRSATPGRGLPVVGGVVGAVSKTTGFDTLGFKAVSSLLRAQSGAAVPDSEVRSYMRAYLPRAGDSQTEVKRKFEELMQSFQTVLDIGAQPSSGMDINELFKQGTTQ